MEGDIGLVCKNEMNKKKMFKMREKNPLKKREQSRLFHKNRREKKTEGLDENDSFSILQIRIPNIFYSLFVVGDEVH